MRLGPAVALAVMGVMLLTACETAKSPQAPQTPQTPPAKSVSGSAPQTGFHAQGQPELNLR